MKAIDVGKLKISPFEFESIIEMRISKRLNEHDTLYAFGVIREENQFAPVSDVTEGTNIICENDGVIYFDGVLQSVKVKCRESVYYLEVYAISNTVLLDTVKYKRSFQDNSQTYESIVESVIKSSGASVTYNASKLTVDNIILQYDETDWEFMKRLASHTQDVLIPITSNKPSFHFGATDKGAAMLETNNIDISKEFIRVLSEDGSQEIKTLLLCCVEMDEFICEMGEKFNVNGSDCFVREISLAYINSALTVTYTLSDKAAISTDKYYNPAIIGLLLNGTVLKVANDNVKLHLAIDEEQDEGTAHLFKYATGYSTEGGTGWYVMPEEGDTVQLLFPNEDEKYAYVASSVRQKDVEKQENVGGGTGDPAIKFLRTSTGKEIKLDGEEVLITAEDGTTFMQINMGTGVVIDTPHPVLINSATATINIESLDDMTIQTTKNLLIKADESIRIENANNIMEFVPADGITVKTDKNYRLFSDIDVAIESGKEMSVTSGKDMTIDSSTKIVESAQVQIDIVAASDTSIVLKSSVMDLNAELIRENP